MCFRQYVIWFAVIQHNEFMIGHQLEHSVYSMFCIYIEYILISYTSITEHYAYANILGIFCFQYEIFIEIHALLQPLSANWVNNCDCRKMPHCVVNISSYTSDSTISILRA